MSNCDVTIIDYGSGNIASVVNMVKRIGYSATVAKDPRELSGAARVILPGVGAFDAGMQKLREREFIDPLTKLAFEAKIPFLGICLGSQLLGRSSEEGKELGLGWLDFECRKFIPEGNLKVPHMGWNFVSTRNMCAVTRDLPQDPRFYFVHSYYMDVHDSSQVLFNTYYGHDFASGVVKENIYGVQFHPEKSHKFGMSLLRSFLEAR
ncbi:imidazole glycerol phosphate synthase subunit HisH [Bdellovibrio sp. BCCA]|uniref:imidazole glycerol phosphate synthase subunit HisH n=1 Tax=Bdellovibrio sp. BCCA TaxID=3136281 RepID=UPI0030F0545B